MQPPNTAKPRKINATVIIQVRMEDQTQNRDYLTMVTTAMLQWSLVVFEAGYPLLGPAPKGLSKFFSTSIDAS